MTPEVVKARAAAALAPGLALEEVARLFGLEKAEELRRAGVRVTVEQKEGTTIVRLHDTHTRPAVMIDPAVLLPAVTEMTDWPKRLMASSDCDACLEGRPMITRADRAWYAMIDRQLARWKARQPRARRPR